jgi:4-hydroxy-tetrahydrodipicolinate synthase
LGTAGEGPVLAEEDRAVAVAAAVESTGGLPIVVGCSGQTVDQVVRQVESAADLGATAALVLPPFYFSLSQDALVRYMTDVADRAAIPVLLYHIPAMTGNPFAVATVERLGLHPNIVGIKDSEGDFVRFLRLQRNLASEEFVVFQGVAALVGPSLLAGCHDSMCTVTALTPELELELREAVVAADLETVRILMHRISAVSELFRLGAYPLPVNFKAVAALLGLGPGQPHDPALLPDSNHRAELRRRLTQLALLSPEASS